jgi:CMP-N-acetylneuraminic acid synthetase
MHITAPFRFQDDLATAWKMFEGKKFDLIQSVMKIRFWLFDITGQPEVALEKTSILSQHCQPRFQPTGSFYIANADYLRSCHYITEGRVGLAEVNEISAIDVDDSTDLQTARFAARCFL